MEIVKVLGIDPSLRNTGLSVVSYNTEMDLDDPKSLEIKHCQVLVNPPKFKGKDAIMNMVDMLKECASLECYQNMDAVLIESPPIMFNKNLSSATVAALGHISGAALALFQLEKAHLFRPNEWNGNRKKTVTQAKIVAFMGDPESWHYEKKTRYRFLEHVVDATGMALWWIRKNYLEE